MSQKEILYLSFGPFSNAINTHFWNAQQSYFTYDHTDLARSTAERSSRNERQAHRDLNDDAGDDVGDEDGRSLIDHDVSFKAGRGVHGEDTYCPRTLVFETQQEFGSLNKLNPLYQSFQLDEGDDGEDQQLLQQLSGHAVSTWGAAAHVQGSQRVPKSDYQRKLELEDQGYGYESDDDDDDDQNEDDVDGNDNERDRSDSRTGTSQRAGATQPPRSSGGSRRRSRFRFWSDYSRVYYHPKSLVTVGGQLMAPMSGSFPSTSDGDDDDGASDGRTRFDRFEQGHTFFKQLERDQDLLDENLRWFAEDSDLLQGFQHTINTSDAFGGLGTAYLEAIRDEFPKATQLVFGAAWGSETPRDEHDRLARLRRMNNALAVASLIEGASLLVPLRVPGSTRTGTKSVQTAGWARHMERIDLQDMHHASALVSTHVETATLGARLRSRPEALPALVARLNWRRDTKLAHLGGCMPSPVSSPPLPSSHRGPPIPLDPIEALLASRGYGSRDRSREAERGTESLAAQTARATRQLEERWLDLSVPDDARVPPRRQRQKVLDGVRHPFAASVMARDAELDNVRLTLGAVDGLVSLREPLGQGLFTPVPYNLPTSYPKFFTRVSANGRAEPPPPPSTPFSPPNTDKDAPSAMPVRGVRPSTVPLLSSLYTTGSTTTLLASMRATLREAIEGHRPLYLYGLGSSSSGSAGAAAGEEDGVVGGRDGLKEVRERVEALVDAYGGGGDEGDDDGGVGTDEEYQIEQTDEEWDL